MSLSTARPRAPDLCGRALDGRYELHALIGEGAFGRVYRGRDRRLARAVAVKVIKPWWAEDPDWVRSFEREAQLMARVSDPGIVQVFDVGYADEGLYYVGELVDGESLQTRLRRGPLAPADALAVAEQLCRALARAHAQHIVHLDIKPANVLISKEGDVKVGDFGVARLAEGTTDRTAGTVVGTPTYMAPEQARGRETSPATDVYSVGVVLYEMLAGRPPFRGGSPVELALCHLQDPPPPLASTVPDALAAVVERALAKEQEARYRDAGEMLNALGQAGDSSSTAPLPATLALPAEPRADSPTTPMAKSGRLSPAPRVSDEGNQLGTTRVAPWMSERRVVNPAGRRRTMAFFSIVLLLLLGMAVAALLIGRINTVRAPGLHGLTRAAVSRTLRRDHLRPEFLVRYSAARRGTVVGQDPEAGTRLRDGSKVSVVLSGGPPPVAVPRLAGISSGDAQAALRRLGLRASVEAVPAPGVAAGTVTREVPSAGAHLFPGSTVSLAVAEIPRWRALTALTDRGGGSSVPFRIRGTRWRIVYRMSFDGVCTFLFVCSGPTAHVEDLGRGASTSSFGLNDGSDQTRTIDSGSGLFQIKVTPGSDTASWSMQVQDYY